MLSYFVVIYRVKYMKYAQEMRLQADNLEGTIPHQRIRYSMLQY